MRWTTLSSEVNGVATPRRTRYRRESPTCDQSALCAIDVDPEDDDGRVHAGAAVRAVLRRLHVVVRGDARRR